MHIRILQQVKDGRLEFPYRQPLTAHTLKHETRDNPQEKKEGNERQHQKSVSRDKNAATLE